MDDGNITPQNPSSKNQSSIKKENKRLNATQKTPSGPRKCLKLTIQREKKKPLVAIFGGLSLRQSKKPVFKDQVLRPYINVVQK